ncbi:ankyrin repeat-containing domain protein [Hypoxylon cercidicola]|nr:ankyrin repeat-containing domain protein [Hypoxylon cercidicola]
MHKFDASGGLVYAAQSGHDAVVEFLLKNGAYVNAQGDERLEGTALIQAAIDGRIRLIQLLLQHGADVYISYGDPQLTALSEAVDKGHADAAMILLEAGADPDGSLEVVSGNKAPVGTPLHTTAWKGGRSGVDGASLRSLEL